MFNSKKLECMKDVVGLALEVGDVRQKQHRLSSRSTHTVFACRVPRDTFDDVVSDMSNQGAEFDPHVPSGNIGLHERVSATHLVSVIAWAGG